MHHTSAGLHDFCTLKPVGRHQLWQSGMAAGVVLPVVKLHVDISKGCGLVVQSSFSIPGMSSSPTAPQMTRTSSGRQISVAPSLNTVLEGDESGDGSPSSSLARIPLDDDDTHAIVRVLEHLIANYKQLSDAPNSPLYKGPRH